MDATESEVVLCEWLPNEKKVKKQIKEVLCQTDKIILQRTIGENWDQLQQPEETFEVKQVFVGENLFIEFPLL